MPYGLQLEDPRAISAKKFHRICRKESEIQKVLQKIAREIETLTEQAKILHLQKEALEQMDFWFEGCPMLDWGYENNHKFAVVHFWREEFGRRQADVYPNRNNPHLYGVRLHGVGCGQGGRFCGSEWESYEAAVEAAKRWVALGEQPCYNGREERG